MGFIRNLTGKNQARAATDAANVQAEFSQEASALLDPFQQLGQQGLDQAGFLTDPQAQFEFLQNNPLFQLSLDNANRVTQASSAARGRLSAGDTLMQLSNNTLLAAQPLLDRQTSNIGNLLNIGQNVAANQGNLLTGEGATLAGGIVGRANANTAAAGNLLTLGGQAATALSDSRLKKNIVKIGTENGHTKYSWKWNELAKRLFNLTGSNFGVIAQEVKKTNPEAIIEIDGYLQVNYNLIGVSHGA